LYSSLLVVASAVIHGVTGVRRMPILLRSAEATRRRARRARPLSDRRVFAVLRVIRQICGTFSWC